MKQLTLVLLFFCSIPCFSQTPDSLESVVIDSLPTRDPQSPDKKSAHVVISSSAAVRGNNWEDRWLSHVEKQALEIGKKLLQQDTAKRIYKAVVRFSINEDGSVKDLQVWSQPVNELVVKECTRIVMTAPKKKPLYRNGKYIRTNIYQPIDIKVNH